MTSRRTKRDGELEKEAAPVAGIERYRAAEAREDMHDVWGRRASFLKDCLQLLGRGGRR